MTRISIVISWLCATGVAVVASYCILTSHKNTPQDQKKATELASCISKHGTIPEYKAQKRHSSAIKKTTEAKVTEKDVKLPTYIPNPIYPPFTNALHRLTEEIAAMAADGEVTLTDGFVLALKDGNPVLQFPDTYTKVAIGGVSMGAELKDGEFGVSRKKIEGTDEQQMDGIGLSKYRRLDEPEFYCTDVTYSMLPVTRQVDSIQMHGNLEVGNTSKAQAMMNEISGWMTEDYGAVDLGVTTPAGTLALKKFKIGNGMDVEVTVKWKSPHTVKGCDADINISFTTSELAEENRYQRQELGKAMDEVRASTLKETGVNYFNVRPTVKADEVAKKLVY